MTDVDFRTPRRLDKALFQQLATSRWIAERRSLLVTGPCGVGKSWLSCALAQKACRDGYAVHYARVPRLFAKCALVSIGTAAIAGGYFIAAFPGLPGTSVGQGLFLFIAASVMPATMSGTKRARLKGRIPSKGRHAAAGAVGEPESISGFISPRSLLN